MSELNINAAEQFFSEKKTQSWIVYLLIFIAIILSFIFYFFPFKNIYENNNTVKKIYFADVITQSHLEIIKRFNNKYKGKIEVIPIDFGYEKFTTNKRKELITRAMRSQSSRIDVYSIDQIWIPRFVKWAEPLGNYFSSDELSQIIKPVLKTCEYNDTLFAVPLFMDLGILYYRKDIINKLPNGEKIEQTINNGGSWEELLSIHKQLNSKYLYVFQGKPYEGLICNFLELTKGNNVNVEMGDFSNLINPRTEKCLQFFVDLINKYHIVPKEVVNFEEAESFKYAVKNDVPFFRGWQNMYRIVNLTKEESEKLRFLRKAPPLHFDGNESYSTIGGWNLMLSKYSQEKEAAITFIKYATSKEAQEILFSFGEYLPINKNFYEDDSLLAKYPTLRFYKALLKKIIQRPSLEDYTKISDIIAGNVNAALKKELSAAEALSKSKREIDAMLQLEK
ncbi:extracellular solute-binding protein [Melioribacteraceae bacterium 4301-Me]|uniref:extracellular solute-binding protein n=1 Tax=Pyranulibacter aquaticus TaxID=3163344 RepID=UPI003599ACA2